MKKTIKGPFEIKATPLPTDESVQKVGASRMMFEKKFFGDLEASSVVSMTGILNNETKSGGYVAIEKISGKVAGKKGSFHMQHSSVMNKGTPLQSISVIPDSGTEELSGIKGSMIIDIVEGKHFYTFEYELSEH